MSLYEKWIKKLALLSTISHFLYTINCAIAVTQLKLDTSMSNNAVYPKCMYVLSLLLIPLSLFWVQSAKHSPPFATCLGTMKQVQHSHAYFVLAGLTKPKTPVMAGINILC